MTFLSHKCNVHGFYKRHLYDELYVRDKDLKFDKSTLPSLEKRVCSRRHGRRISMFTNSIE